MPHRWLAWRSVHLGPTPLLVAVEYRGSEYRGSEYRGSESMAHRLLDRGRANPDVLRKAQLDAARTFASTGREQIQLLLGMIGGFAPAVLPLRWNDRLIELLLEAGADIGAGGGEHSSGLSTVPIILILRIWVDVDILCVTGWL